MSTKNSQPASVIRRPTGAAPSTRAKATFQQPPSTPTPSEAPKATPEETNQEASKEAATATSGAETATAAPAASTEGGLHRTQVVYSPGLRRALRALAFNERASVSDLVRKAISAADPEVLAAASEPYLRLRGDRSTIDLPAAQHTALRVASINADSTVQALILAAIYRAYPDLPLR